MKKLIKYKTDNGNEVMLEVFENDTEKSTGMSDVSGIRNAITNVVETANESFDATLNNVYSFADTVIKKLSHLQPQNVEVEFGVTFSAEAGAIITSIGAEANLKIKLTWINDKKSD